MSILSRFSYVPRRCFGRGKNPRIFGHGPTPKSNMKFDSWAPGAIFILMGISFVNWRWVFESLLKIPVGKEDTPRLVRMLAEDINFESTNKPLNLSQDERKVKLTSHLHVLKEKEVEIKDYLIRMAKRKYKEDEMEEVQKRILEMNFSDPEVVSILRNVQHPFPIKDEEKYEKCLEIVDKSLSRKKFSIFTLLAEEENLATEFENFKREAGGSNLRDRQIMEYENRIRQYSTPDKIFRYFATIKVVDEKGHFAVMMTPQDFLRSLTPGEKQPEAYGLDSFAQISVEEMKMLTPDRIGVEKSSIFHHFGASGLLSFSDYIFLLTILGTSMRHFEIAFKMFDLNGDGNVDVKEFEFVTNLMKSQSSVGSRHRDHQASTFKGINSGLISYLFGPDRNRLLNVETFVEFQKSLQKEILVLEFKKKMKGEGVIGELDFADLLITYAGFNPTKKQRVLKRVQSRSESQSVGITLKDYLNFFQVLYNINDVDAALTFYHIAGAPIERKTFKHVAMAVAGVNLSDHVLDVVFTLFDDNGDGKLSNREFLSVMKQRAMRGLEKPKDTGAGKMINAIATCAKSAALAQV